MRLPPTHEHHANHEHEHDEHADEHKHEHETHAMSMNTMVSMSTTCGHIVRPHDQGIVGDGMARHAMTSSLRSNDFKVRWLLLTPWVSCGTSMDIMVASCMADGKWQLLHGLAQVASGGMWQVQQQWWMVLALIDVCVVVPLQ